MKAYKRLRLSILIFSSLFILLSNSSAFAAQLPQDFTESQVVVGISSATAMAFAPDGRIFVCEQTGRLRVVKNGTFLPSPFLTVNVSSSGERGLLGIAFDPDFVNNGYVYIYYTVPGSPAHNRVSRFTADGDASVPGSETIILELNNLSSATNHNGGAMHFGEDGKLYIAVGENANGSNSQSLSNLLGKILRINSDGTIPADNPFFTTASGANRAIWAMGLRNPFTFAFQPGTQRMFINDVGQSTWEEINDGIAGANYGWPSTEGPTSDDRFKTPFYAYQHTGGICAITGGAFYNPANSQFPDEYVGKYFFADFCAGFIKALNPANGSVSDFASDIAFPVDLQTGPDGALYYLSRGSGSIFKIEYSLNSPPSITLQPSNQTAAVGQAAVFTVSASGSMPLSYQWQSNGFDIPAAQSPSYTISSALLSDTGSVFRCKVSNSLGNVVSNGAVLTVIDNFPPVPVIISPTAGLLYTAGTTIFFSGKGSDPEDGALTASAFTWQVDFHHDDHVHPFIQPNSSITGGSFVIPNVGETAPDVFYRIILTVKDSLGQTATVFRDILPRVSVLTVATNPPGLQIMIDGQPQTAPFQFRSVAGVRVILGTASQQTVNGETFLFRSWSDGGAVSHTITMTTTNRTLTATFGAGPPLAPSNAAAAPLSSNQISVSWTDNSRVESGFKIERCVGSSCTTFAQIASVGVNATSYVNTGLPTNTTYKYRIRAFNAAGNSGYTEIVQATTLPPPPPPSAPGNPSAAARSHKEIVLSWTDNSDNETGFKIERCVGAACTSFAQIALVGANATSYVNTGLAANTTYKYRIRAYNSSGNSAYSEIAQATTKPLPPPPTAPSDLVAAEILFRTIALSWTDNSSDETGFRVERCTGATCLTFGLLKTVGSNATSFTDISVSSGLTYRYRIRAFNDGGISRESNTVTVKAP